MAFVSNSSGIAASVFLAIYSVFFVVALCAVVPKRFVTVLTFIFLLVVVRVASQVCGVIYASLTSPSESVLIAYLILSSQGYFFILMGVFRFIIREQKREYGHSWLLNLGPQLQLPILSKMTKTWAKTFRAIVVPGNVLVIVGGITLTGINVQDLANEQSKVNLSKVLRTIGQAILLAVTVVVLLLNVYVYYRERIRKWTLVAVMLLSPFILVRGTFGICSVFIPEMNYFDMSNYVNGEINHRLLIYEYVLSTTMEFIAAVILMTTWFDDRNPIENYTERKELYDPEAYSGLER